MKKLWAGAAIASDGWFNHCISFAFLANTKEEAKGIIYDKMMKEFPPAEGYSAHALDVADATKLALFIAKQKEK